MAHRIEGSRVRALDGLRGVALLAVLGYHALPGTVRGGFLGVDVFFVLSGFLLTSLLLDEYQRTGGIDRRRYASRRVRRLVPAGFVVLFAIAVLGPLVASDAAARLRGDILWSAVGLTNWHLIAEGSSYFSRVGRPPLVRHFWSLAIEVQFYVVCPFLVGWLAARRRRVAIGAVAAGIGLSAFAMWSMYRAPDPYRAYYGTDARVGALLAGVLLALLLQRGDARRFFAWLAGPAAAIVVVLFFVADDRSRLLYPEGFLLVQAATMTLIAGAVGRGSAASVLRSRPLRWLGERSYGIYLWHWPLVALLRPHVDVPWPSVATAVVTTGAALVLGALSFRFVEQPILRGPRRVRNPVVRRHRLVAAWSAAGLAVVLLAVLTARLPTRDPIAASLRAGERIVAAQELASATDPSAGATPAPAGPQSDERTPSSRQPVRMQPVVAVVHPVHVSTSAIGDSVMLGAAGPLHDQLGSSSYIDAKKNRQYRDATAVARDMRVKGRLGHVVVVHLGNNGPAKRADIDAVLNYLRDARRVLLVTVRVDKGWQASVNDTLRAAAKGRSQVRIVDWYGYSGGHADWFWSDGTHLRPAGAREYAKLIASSVPPEPKPTPAPTPSPTPTPGLLPPLKP